MRIRFTHRACALVGALAVCATATLGVTVAQPASAAGATGAGVGAMTKSGTGEFSALDVTVGQTKNLVDQVVEISWKGGQRTLPGGDAFGANYLQIMQCWGDDAEGPDREQCQFGGLTGDSRGGAQASTRQVSSTAVDPLETIKPDVANNKQAYVPFRSYEGEVSSGGVSDLFDSQSTNEIPFAQTRTGGVGQAFFTMQTVAESAGLGCGSPVTVGGTTKGRGCWLVVVPRGDREVDGTVRSNPGSNPLASSPLSQTNWNERIVFPLEFGLVGKACAIGGAERKVAGHEVVSEAVLRWQPSLCAGGETVYSYTQLGDAAARRELLTEDPGVVVVTNPLSAVENTDKRSVLYAPIALSSLTVAYNVDRQSRFGSSDEVKARNGERLTSMRLTPRLVAKLLTQSYKRAAHMDAPNVQGNPTDLTKDPEFLALNPDFASLNVSLPELLLPVGRADVVELVWNWLLGDPAAKAFLDGKPDEHGMKLNRDYAATEFPRDDYPKADSYCTEPRYDGTPARCTLDMHPYADDMLAAARAASRGDTLTRSVWDTSNQPHSWKKDEAQQSGRRALLALVDTAAADRYGLETAEVRNAAGTFVAPTTTSLTAALTAMGKSTVPSVLAPAPSTKAKSAYPLTSVSYAATVPSVLDAAERADYAKMLTYAVGAGQVPGVAPGTLPYGYAPLPESMREQTRAAAADLLKGKGTPGSTGTDEGDKPPSAQAISKNLPDGVGSTDGLGAAGPSGTDGGETTATTTPAPSALEGSTLASARTAGLTAGLLRWAPLLAVGVGLAALVAGPVLMRSATGAPAPWTGRKRPRVFAR